MAAAALCFTRAKPRIVALFCWGVVAAIALSGLDIALVHASTPAKMTGDAAAMKQRRAVLGAARSWAYQLRINDLAPLFAAEADLLVVDHGYAARRLGKLMFDPADVLKLKTKPDGSRRIVLAYMSIGEAEQYRFYWQAEWCRRATAPTWIGAVNPNWPGNYPARFWDAAWQKLILDPTSGYLARIQAQGFDGVYLDRTDVYSEWLKERPTAEADMIAFLQGIAAAGRADNPKFLVVLQNAEELLVHKAVRRLLDGVAKEDLLYGESFSETPNSAAAVNTSRKYLQRARADHIPVFAVEYLSDAERSAAVRKQLATFGFVPTLAPRLLDRLIPQPGATLRPEVNGTPTLLAPTPPSPGENVAPNVGEGGPTCLID